MAKSTAGNKHTSRYERKDEILRSSDNLRFVKNVTPKLEGLDPLMLEQQRELVASISTVLLSQLEEAIVEGLRLKGFVFTERRLLIEFVAARCNSYQLQGGAKRVYCIDKKPFFWHVRNTQINTEVFEGNRKASISATIGSYGYII